MNIRILLVDDHDVIRAGLRSIIDAQPNMEVIAEASDGREAVRLAAELSPDVVVSDISMPELNGLEATRQIRAESDGDIRVVVLSMHADRRFVNEALKAGAAGFLLKNSVML